MDLNKAGLFILRSAVAGVGWGSLSSILCSSNVGFTEKKQTEASFAISSIFFFSLLDKACLKRKFFPGFSQHSFCDWRRGRWVFEIQAFRLLLSAHPLARDIEHVLMINVSLHHLHHFRTCSILSVVKIKIAYIFKDLTGICYVNYALHIHVKKLVITPSIILQKINF